ncbi:MAG: MFS transporter [Elusimicrobiota bacterium]
MAEQINTFSAFKHRNFMLLWIGTVVSHVGDFMQMIAQSWLVLTLTNSPLAIGLVAFCQAAPRLVLSPLLGVFSDRMDRKRFMIFAQWVAMLQALVFGVLVAFDVIQFWHIIIIALVLGIANSVGQINRQAMISSIVPREDITNAVALNAGAMNAAKVVGPAIAGILVSTIGIAGCLFINAASFIAILAALYLMDIPKVERMNKIRSVTAETMEAVRYVFKDREVLLGILIVYGMGLFGMAYSRLMPVFARDILFMGPEGYGYLMTLPGVGAIISILFIANLRGNINRGRIVIVSNLIFGVTLLIFSFSKNVILTAACLIMLGASQLFCRSLTNVIIQHNVPDEMRGRVLSFMFMDIGLWAMGSFLLGMLAEYTSAPLAISVGATLCMMVPLTIFAYKRTRKTS